MPRLKTETKIDKKLEKLIQKEKTIEKSKEPLWSGPIEEGLTQSIMWGWIACRERARVKLIDGLKIGDRFSKAMEYGNFWHLCEEYYHGGKDYKTPLLEYTTDLCRRYKSDQHDIVKFYRICLMQFEVYLKYWEGHEFGTNIESVEQEMVFKVPYKLPDGRIVKLRGMFDGVLKLKKGRGHVLYLQENKAKGTVDEIKIQKQLGFDLQTGVYLVALREYLRENPDKYGTEKIAGICYNVIRRPLAGGKGSIKQKKPTTKNPAGESMEEFLERLKVDYIEDDPGHYFMRWRVEYPMDELDRFCKEVLNPVLTNICDWYTWVSSTRGRFDPFMNSCHWRHPYGGYNVVDEVGMSDIDSYINDGNKVGLVPIETLFPELER